jgi:ABC-type nickel/cobalt efflux system permease component RcnA
MSGFGFPVKSFFTSILGFLFLAGPVYAHIADEIAVKTTVEFNEEDIIFRFDISSGVLFSTAFLKILDPDKSKTFEADHIRAFSDFFQQSVQIQFQGEDQPLLFDCFTASDWNYFAAGISTIVLDYRLIPDTAYNTIDLKYEISFYPETAGYSLGLVNNFPQGLAILKERRNEFLQDVLELQYTTDREIIAAIREREKPELVPVSAPVLAENNLKVPLKKRIGDFLRNGFETFGILDFLRGKQMADRTLALLLIMAVVVGFLHAFTPGHGKALVGAFLIANQGTALHALCLGVVLTLTHTVSIYAFGLAASTAARFFLPGELFPVLSVICGFFIVGIGIWGFVKRLIGKEVDHAHLIPNLQILGRETVNILVDGQAAEANEALLIALDDEYLQESLKAAGAETFNLCSPGCSTHDRLPPAIRERQRSEFFKIAIKTGAVDAVITRSDRTIKYIGKLRDQTWIQKSDAVMERPQELLFRAIHHYSSRGEISIPENKLSWGRVISLGVTGGIIPCPDALAVLLVAIAAGRLTLGMGIIFLFSLGLTIALILVGIAIVLTKRLLVRQRRLAGVVQYIPYFSSLLITTLGVLMIHGVFRTSTGF